METVHTAPEANLIQSVVKALDVLQCLASADHPLSVREVAQKCGFSRPTAYRLLSTLMSRNYVQTTRDGQYQMGTGILSLGKSILDRLDLPEIARPHLSKLSRRTGETTYLSILDGTEILYVAKAESTQPVYMLCSIGTRNPAYCTSMGKAILAFLAREERDRLVDSISLEPYTAHTIVDRDKLIAHLEKVRVQRFAIDDMEKEQGIRCVGAPIFDHTGQVVAAISASGPAHRLTLPRLKELARPVTETANAISIELGYTLALRHEKT